MKAESPRLRLWLIATALILTTLILTPVAPSWPPSRTIRKHLPSRQNSQRGESP